MKGSLLFLGSGSSTGIPLIGCRCPVCSSTNVKNKRLRPSALVTIGEKKLLIDAGPDFRYQALNYNICHLDGVLITHTHFDHVAGIDELRIFHFHTKKTLPILCSIETYESLKTRYDYLFVETNGEGVLSERLAFQLLHSEKAEVEFCDLPIAFVSYHQGRTLVTGYRFGNLAYFTDIKHYSPTIFESLKGVETLILNALCHKPSPMHLTVAEAIAFVQTAKVPKGILTHICHLMDHAEEKSLPEGICLAYDGLHVPFEIN